jgi:predicted nucleic acid-binding protein
MTADSIILLDSSVLIDALRNRNGRRALLAHLALAGKTLATSAINVAEIYSGMRAIEEQTTARLFEPLEVYPVSSEIAEQAGRLRSQLRSQGITRNLPDTIVAATALWLNCPVATDNVRDFQFPGLNLLSLP